MKRRDFLRSTAALGAGMGLAGCGRTESVPQSPVDYKPGGPLPWINWAGNEYCYPNARPAPRTTAELVDVMQQAGGSVRAVGAGHSFSAVVPTDDTLISTDLMTGLIAHDPGSLQARVYAGTTLHDLGPLLHGIGQAVPNLPDMDYPTLGGAIATSVHGTGTGFGSLSAGVTGLTLVSPSGEVFECSPASNVEVFNAARCSVGALGVTSEVTLQNQAPFRLTEVNRVEPLADVWASLGDRCEKHRHFEFFPVPYSELCITVTTDPALPGDRDEGRDDPYGVLALRQAFEAVGWIPFFGPSIYDRLLQLSVADAAETVRTGHSFEVLPHVRIVRFREMEYTVPADAGPACVQEILATIRDRRLPVSFPFEYRYVKADDIWLSMFEGRDGCSISIHQYGDLEYRHVFAEIEPIFWKYEGRPHWGKIHTLDAKRLKTLYPRWQDFQEVREALDPDSRMLNPHLRSLFT